MSDDRWALKKTVKNPDAKQDWSICVFPTCVASGLCTPQCAERNHSDYTPQIIAQGHKRYLSMSESERTEMIDRLRRSTQQMGKCIYPRCIQTGGCTPGCIETNLHETVRTDPPSEAMKNALDQLRSGPPMTVPKGATIHHLAPSGPALFKKLGADTLDPITENYPVIYKPTRSREGDAGYDLYISRPARILVNRMEDLHTDIAIALPPGYFGRITGRSSTLRKRGLLVNEGIIDNGYRGEMFIAVFNLSGEVANVFAGERLAQLIIQRIETVNWQETKDPLPASDRGSLGFGSTGK